MDTLMLNEHKKEISNIYRFLLSLPSFIWKYGNFLKSTEICSLLNILQDTYLNMHGKFSVRFVSEAILHLRYARLTDGFSIAHNMNYLNLRTAFCDQYVNGPRPRGTWPTWYGARGNWHASYMRTRLIAANLNQQILQMGEFMNALSTWSNSQAVINCVEVYKLNFQDYSYSIIDNTSFNIFSVTPIEWRQIITVVTNNQIKVLDESLSFEVLDSFYCIGEFFSWPKP